MAMTKSNFNRLKIPVTEKKMERKNCFTHYYDYC